MFQNVRETIKNDFQIAPRWLLVRWIAPQIVPELHILAPRCFQNNPQMTPKWLQMAPKWLQDGFLCVRWRRRGAHYVKNRLKP